jgi:hypothetical protein
MSDVLMDYFGNPSSSLGTLAANRYRCFAESIGGVVSGNHITNASAIRGPAASRVQSFADAFYTKIRGFPNTTDIADRMEMLIQSERAVDWFLAWLERRM